MSDNPSNPTPPSDNQTPPPAAWYGDGHKDFVTGKGWKSGDDAITSYKNLETLVGAEKAGRTVVLPKDDNDAEGMKAFRAKLGVPEKVDGYARPESLKDDALFPLAAQAALEAGIPAKSFDGFLGKVLAAAEGLRTKADTESRAAADKALADLKTKHGAEFDAKVALGKRLVTALGYDDAKLAQIESAFGTADMMELFINLGAKVGEPAPGGGTRDGGNTSQADAQAKIDDARAKRIANQMTEKDYQTVIEKYGPIASPGFQDDQGRKIA